MGDGGQFRSLLAAEVKFGGIWIHGRCGLGALLKGGGKDFAGAMQFSADGVGGLVGEIGDLLVTEFFIGHQ